MTPAEFADLVSATSVLVAALAFLGGVNAWRREFVGKRRIELAESVLTRFYEAEDAVRHIRNPVSTDAEVAALEQRPGETPSEFQLRKRAFVPFARFQSYEKLFAELRSMRYQFMAAFGAQAAEPFNDLDAVIRKILASAHMLGSTYWPRQGVVPMSQEEREEHLTAMHQHEAVFWQTTSEDAISIAVRAAAAKVETITQKAVANASRRFQLW